MEKTFYMRRALELAERGWGQTSPNPLVGAVIVKNGVIVGEGWHERFGAAHAETIALAAAGEAAQGADIYVNLEPCSHFGRTPPCVDAIISAGIKRVFLAINDPNPLVAGRGVAKLRQSGVVVENGLLAEDACRLNDIFCKYIVSKRPFVIMKTAMTLDGKIASYTGDSRWVSGAASQMFVHHWRQRLAAVMVGINTVLRDNPQLTTRLPGQEIGGKWRIVLDSQGRTPLDCQLFMTKTSKPVIVATTEQMSKAKEQALKTQGALVIRTSGNRVDLPELMLRLGAEGIDSIMLEGGGTVNAAAWQSGSIDRVMMIIAPKIIGGKSAPTPLDGEGEAIMDKAHELFAVQYKQLGTDMLVDGYTRAGEICSQA